MEKWGCIVHFAKWYIFSGERTKRLEIGGKDAFYDMKTYACNVIAYKYKYGVYNLVVITIVLKLERLQIENRKGIAKLFVQKAAIWKYSSILKATDTNW